MSVVKCNPLVCNSLVTFYMKSGNVIKIKCLNPQIADLNELQRSYQVDNTEFVFSIDLKEIEGFTIEEINV